LDEKIDQR